MNKYYDKMKMNSENINIVIDMYNSGSSIYDIAEEIGVNPSTIRNWLISSDVKIRGHNNGLDDYANDIIDLYNNGLTTYNIAQKYNVSRSSICYFLKKHNILTRKPAETSKIYKINEEYFDLIDTEEKAYFLGFLYSDGNSSKIGNRISIRLQEDDREILEKLKNLLDTNKELYFIPKSRPECKNQVELSITNKHIWNSLFNYGVVPNKTFIVKYPVFLKDSLHRHFIRGIMDGDGCITKYKEKNKYGVYIYGTLDLLQGIKDNIKIKAEVNCYIRERKGCYELCICGNKQVMRFLDYIYEDSVIYMERKYRIYLSFK